MTILPMPIDCASDNSARRCWVSLNRLSEFTDTAAVIAVGSPRVRKAIENRTSHLRFRWATLVHPTATVGLNVRLGEGTIVAAGARLSTNINVGAHVQLDTNVTIGHDCDIASFARVNPGACVSGSVEIGQGALIGANATVLQCLRVGSAAVVGAAACVVADVVPGTTVKGVPAR